MWRVLLYSPELCGHRAFRTEATTAQNAVAIALQAARELFKVPINEWQVAKVEPFTKWTPEQRHDHRTKMLALAC